ncbi:MAG: glutamine synthetase [Nitrospirae bacterium]|nr:glutamine synthetase [Candidatus Troglogloeales bacterium]
MANLIGMLTLATLTQKIRSGEIDTVLLVFTDHYGRCMGKRLDADFFLDDAAANGTHACNYLLTVDMEMQPTPGYQLANWQKGYGDFHLVPDFATLRIASWLPKTALILCDVEDDKNHSPVSQAPRSILKRQVERATQLGYAAMAASELEYYIYQNSYRDSAERGYKNLTPVGWYLEDYHLLQGSREEVFNGAARRHLKASGIPVESSKGEWGLGQHELNIRYSDILTMADRHTIFKECLKEVADQMGIAVTFMAKIASNQAGSSSHIHISLWRDNPQGSHPLNLFSGNEQWGPVACSNIFKWFLGGFIAHAPEVMVFYAPTINSYKRYRAGSWAPTRLAVSYDNRTAGFRVVGAGNSLRIECRIPGADCNPYLTFAAALASGINGIVNKIEPPEIFDGDVYAAESLPTVPNTLRDATKIFEQSAFAKKAFGEEVVAHYLHFFKTEQEAYDKAVTDWERQRYFERI